MSARFSAALLACLLLSGAAFAEPSVSAPAPVKLSGSAEPVRGVWIPTPDHTGFWTSRTSIEKHLDELSAAGINSVFVVMWNQGRTFYPSKLMEGLTGIAIDERMKGRDPLREVVEAAKPRKMRVYAWFEFGFATDVRGGKGSEIARARPEWMALNSKGEPLVKNGFRWLNALDPAVQDFMLSLLMEVVDGYDVTGIQGDDRLPALPVEGGYNANVVTAYRAAHEGHEPPANPKDKAWVQWRSDRLSQFMQRIFAETKKRKPAMQVAMSPSVFPFSRDEYLQDWPAWVKNGWVDLVSPQLYRKDMLHYQSAVNAVVNKQVAAADLHKVAPGVLLNLGKSYAASAELLKQMVEANRKAGITGEVFFYNEGVGEKVELLRDLYFVRATTSETRVLGIWEAGDSAHAAIYGFLKITPQHIYFSAKGKKWECPTTYKIVESGSGDTYPDQSEVFRHLVKGRKWEFFKIALGRSKCTYSAFFLFAFPSDIENYADFVDYTSDSKYGGRGHFHRVSIKADSGAP